MIPILTTTLEEYLVQLNHDLIFDEYQIKQLIRFAQEKSDEVLMHYAADRLSLLTLEDSQETDHNARQFWASLYRALAGFPMNLGTTYASIKFVKPEELVAAYQAAQAPNAALDQTPAELDSQSAD